MRPQKAIYTKVVETDRIQAANDIAYAQQTPPEPCFISYNPAFQDALGDSPSLQLIEERQDKFAHEAGVYISNGCNYFTSNYYSHQPAKTYEVDHSTHEIREVSYSDVVNPNGACNYQDKVLFCSQGDLDTPSGESKSRYNYLIRPITQPFLPPPIY